jgi:hypothetical protein
MRKLILERANLSRAVAGLAGLAVLLLLASVVLAQSGGGISRALSAGYDLSWASVDGGGTTLNAVGDYALGGTAGQPDAGVLAAGEYTLGGGFWRGGALPPGPDTFELYLPLVLREA